MTEATETNQEHPTRSERRRVNQSTQREVERVDSIQRLAELYDADDDFTREYIANGGSPEKFRNALRERMPKAPQNPQQDASIGMTREEVDRFSFVRAIRAQIDPRYAQREAGLEIEASRAQAKLLGKEPQGLFIPVDVMHRDLTVGTAADGGNLVATNLLAADFITLLRNATRVFELGARVMSGLVGNVAIPRQNGTSTAYWVAEGSAPTESQPSFDQVSMSPETVGAYTDYTRKLILQGTPDIESLVRADLAAVLGQAIDLASINGSGASNQPTGILQTAGIGSVAIGTNGGAPTYEHMVDLLSSLAGNNADMGTLAFLTNSDVRGKLLKTTKVSGDAGAGFVWEGGAGPEGRMLGFRAAVSNQVPNNLTKGTGTDLSAILFGNWSDLLVGQWSGLDLLVDPYSLSSSGGVRVVAMQDVDIAVRHAESFAAIVDAVTT